MLLVRLSEIETQLLELRIDLGKLLLLVVDLPAQRPLAHLPQLAHQ